MCSAAPPPSWAERATMRQTCLAWAGCAQAISKPRCLMGVKVVIAFVPMNLPFTMDVDQASSAVAEFKPDVVYPYHYKGSDPQAFAAKVTAAAPDTKVVQGAWYG